MGHKCIDIDDKLDGTLFHLIELVFVFLLFFQYAIMDLNVILFFLSIIENVIEFHLNGVINGPRN